jgi:hypothetical protein
MNKRTRINNRRLTGEQRAEFARARQKLCGTLITQKGFEAYLVLEHIRGSQYLVRRPDGAQIYMSHKKPKYEPGYRKFLTAGGWKLWEDRQ